jgi:four helix bundle protein
LVLWLAGCALVVLGGDVALRRYQDLIAWQKAMDLVTRVYEVTGGFPRREMYGLTNQLRRAAVSVPSNIAEGQGRKAGREFLRYLAISRGSLQELETQIIIASRLGYIEEPEHIDLIEKITEVSRVISGLSNSLSDPEPASDS